MCGLVLGVCLVGCSPKSDVNSAAAFVAEFHKDLSAKEYDRLGTLIDPEFRAEATNDRFNQVRTTLGELRSSKMSNYTVIYEMRAAKVRLDFDSQFLRGPAKEVFEVKQQNGKNSITGYRIDSPLLNLK